MLYHQHFFFIVPALQMKKQKHRGDKRVVQGHIVNEWQRATQSGQPGQGSCPLTTVLHCI